MEPNTNEATAPKRLKTGGKKPIIIIGVIVAVLLAAHVGLCAYANSLDIFYPNTTINGVDVAGLTAEQAAERLRQEIPEETVEFYLPLADETGDGESAPEGDMLYGADPDAVCTYRELGITEELDYEVSAQSAFDAVQGRSSFFVKGWEYLACLVGADGQLGVVLEPEEDIFQVKMEQLSEQFSREAQDASYEVTEDAVEITKALNGLSVSAADLARTAQERWTGSGNGAAASVFVNNARILPAKTLTAQQLHDQLHGEVRNASYDSATDTIVPEQLGADFDIAAVQKAMDEAAPGETLTVKADIQQPEVTAADLKAVLFRDVLGEAKTHVSGSAGRIGNVKLSAQIINGLVLNSGETFSYNDTLGERTAEKGYKPAPAYSGNRLTDAIGGGVCQGSSTLYNCVLLADLEVVTRSCHGATVAYLPLGLDAAVNWGTTDFQFRNNFHFPVKIEAETTEDLVKMRILGTDEKDYYIEMTSGYDDSREDVIYAVSYKNKYSKETGELISKDREAFSTYYRNVG